MRMKLLVVVGGGCEAGGATAVAIANGRASASASVALDLALAVAAVVVVVVAVAVAVGGDGGFGFGRGGGVSGNAPLSATIAILAQDKRTSVNEVICFLYHLHCLIIPCSQTVFGMGSLKPTLLPLWRYGYRRQKYRN